VGDMMEWINQLIVGIFETYNTNDPFDILNEMEVEVIKVEKSSPILLKKNCMYVAELNKVFIRNDLVSNYELFYLRHELGHILLHLDSNNLLIVNNRRIEKEANYFAFKLSNITFDEVELYQMSLEQICCTLQLPFNAINQLVTV
jgi:Zn-dependent peptidase ImmA (M78 family)